MRCGASTPRCTGRRWPPRTGRDADVRYADEEEAVAENLTAAAAAAEKVAANAEAEYQALLVSAQADYLIPGQPAPMAYSAYDRKVARPCDRHP